MPNSYDSKFLDDPEFQSLLVGCLESLERGETIDRDALVQDFPKYAAEIGQFLNDRNLLQQVASDFGDVSPSRVTVSAYTNTMDSASTNKGFSLGETVRYIGEYEILEEIARGGMGVVFKARQQKLGRTVALKMILAGRLADSSDVERFYREARAAGQLTHTNIVPVHEVGEHDGRHYFTMDYVEGCSLADTIRDETLAPQKAAELVESIAQAIQYAHEQGTVHRDLKPANVLLDSAGEPKVTDFGLAKMLGGGDDETLAELTATGQILGTPSYMSPEQASGNQELVGPASDIYSLGAILYACLTGRAPFVADSPVDTLLQVMKKDPVSPRELNPSVPKDLETICLKCLTKEPHKRYGSAQTLANDLGNYLAGRPISARSVTRLERTWRWAARNPVVATLTSMVALSLIAGAGISSYFAIDARERANEERRAKEREAELRIETEQLAEDLQESLNLESELRGKAQREQQLAKAAEQRAKQAQAEEATQRKFAEEQKKLAVEREQQARWHLYVSQLYPLMNLWKQGDIGQLDRLLTESVPDESEPDFRGWEWFYLRDQTRQHFRRLPIAKQDSLVSYHVESKRLAVLFKDRLEIWDPWSDTKESEIPVKAWLHAQHVIDWSPDGSRLVFVKPDRTVQIVDIQTGREVLSFDPELRDDIHLRGAAWSPDGKRIATASWFGDVKIWDAGTGELQSVARKADQKDNLGALCWHPDSNRLALGLRYGWTHVIDVDQGKLLWGKKAPNNTGGTSIAWSPNGELLAAGHGGVALYQEDGTRLHYFDCHRGDSRDIAWLDDELFVSGAADQDVVLLNATEKKEVERLVYHSNSINSVVWDRDQERLITAAYKGSVKVAKLSGDQQPFTILKHFRENRVHEISFSPDDELMVAASDNQAAVWEVQTKEQISKFAGNKPVWYANWIHQLRWRPDSQIVVGTCKAAQPVIWQRKTGTAFYPREEADFQPWAAAWSPDGQCLALSGEKRSQLWKGDSFELLNEFDPTGHVHWYPNQQTVRIGSTSVDREKLEVISTGEPELVFVSPDRKYSAQVATADRGRAAISIISTYDGKTVATLRGHNAKIEKLAWSPDGRRIGSASSDGTIKIWDSATGDLLITLPHPSGEPYYSLSWNQNGKILAAGTTNGEIHLYGRWEMKPIPECDFLGSGVLAAVKTPDERESELRREIELNPDTGKAWTDLIDLLEKMQKWNQAVDVIDEYLAHVSPHDSWRPSEGLLAAAAAGDDEAVQKFASRCLTIVRDDAKSDNVRAHALLALGNAAARMDDYETALQVTRRHAKASPDWYRHAPLALTLLRAKQFDRLRDVLKPFSDDERPRFRSVILLIETLIALEKGELELARHQFKSADAIFQKLPRGFVPYPTEQIVAISLHREAARRLELLREVETVWQPGERQKAPKALELQSMGNVVINHVLRNEARDLIGE